MQATGTTMLRRGLALNLILSVSSVIGLSTFSDNLMPNPGGETVISSAAFPEQLTVHRTQMAEQVPEDWYGHGKKRLTGRPPRREGRGLVR